MLALHLPPICPCKLFSVGETLLSANFLWALGQFAKQLDIFILVKKYLVRKVWNAIPRQKWTERLEEA